MLFWLEKQAFILFDVDTQKKMISLHESGGCYVAVVLVMYEEKNQASFIENGGESGKYSHIG